MGYSCLDLCRWNPTPGRFTGLAEYAGQAVHTAGEVAKHRHLVACTKLQTLKRQTAKQGFRGAFVPDFQDDGAYVAGVDSGPGRLVPLPRSHRGHRTVGGEKPGSCN